MAGALIFYVFQLFLEMTEPIDGTFFCKGFKPPTRQPLWPRRWDDVEPQVALYAVASEEAFFFCWGDGFLNLISERFLVWPKFSFFRLILVLPNLGDLFVYLI